MGSCREVQFADRTFGLRSEDPANARNPDHNIPIDIPTGGPAEIDNSHRNEETKSRDPDHNIDPLKFPQL